MTTPTGGIESQDGVVRLVIERTVPAPVEAVWAAASEPDGLSGWLGTLTGDPAAGTVSFRMTAEGADAPDADVVIRECVPPRRLAVTTQVGEDRWHLELDLEPVGAGTRVLFTQSEIDPAAVADIGPGWEYYLDRLVVFLAGEDVGSVDWDRDYYPAMQEHYRAQVTG